MVSLVKDFPEPIDSDGVCVHLKDNRCSIYETRPLICRVDDYYEVVKDEFKSKDHYIYYTINLCNTMITEVGLDKKFLIPKTMLTVKNLNHDTIKNKSDY
jgi:Fe-S-cluster containining protein